LVDALRAAASTTILWHHLTYFGPVSDWAMPAAPHLITWLFDYGAMAVQVFLVLGGFMTARSLAGRTFGWREAATFAVQRYCRLALPYLAMLVVAIAAAAWARPWLPEDVVGLPPTMGQVVSHVFLLQYILDYERLSSGVWYVCIDFQLGLLLVGILLSRDWLSRICGRPLPRLSLLIGWVLAAASLFYFNRNPDLNMWGVYFFGSFFLGVLVHYELADRRPPVLLILYVLMMAAALAIQWRTRLAVGTTTGLLLYVSGRLGWFEHWPKSRVI
jgi:peptidoglycan/LPS O-acetylase OafA/YrhL